MIPKIMVVDDEKLVRDFLVETLKRKKYEVQAFDTGQKALSYLKDNKVDLAITDMKMPGLTGMDVLKKIKEISPATIVIIITAYGSIENAVEAMRMGAFNYLIKPFSPDDIEAMIEKARELLVEPIIENGTQVTFNAIGESPAMKKIFSDVERIAKSNANVLITGESGTGKEVIAQLIHDHSARADKPFIKVNCAAVPETLMESEFFGHEKGAFTGASNLHRGRFELAHKGSLLLDEITEVSPGLQAKLLRAVQEQEIERLGGTHPINVDVRIISTSNRDVKEAIEAQKFREDLFYRLNVMHIHIPPLRDRKEDILPLASFFLNKLSKENHKEITFSAEAKKKLTGYNWPGNVRELTNVIERAVVLNTTGTIMEEEVHTIPLHNPPETLQDMEKQLIINTLKEMNHNRTKTAEKLGISVRTLRNKLQEYDADKKS